VGETEEGAIQLPAVGAPVEIPGQTSVVVSYRRENVILFEGGVYSLPDLKKQMTDYVKKHPGAVLLIRADRQVSVQAFFDLCDMARSAGFASVQAAAEPQGPESPLR
jgi:biopolymer transport protein ExbD